MGVDENQGDPDRKALRKMKSKGCESGRCYIGETGRPLGVRDTRTYEQLKTGTDGEIQDS
jgi:hypothetical protein